LVCQNCALPNSVFTTLEPLCRPETRGYHPDPYLTINFVNLNWIPANGWTRETFWEQMHSSSPLRRMRCQGLRRFNGGGTPGAREGGAVLDQDEKPDVCSSPFELLKQKNIYLVVVVHKNMMLLLLCQSWKKERSGESDSTA